MHSTIQVDEEASTMSPQHEKHRPSSYMHRGVFGDWPSSTTTAASQSSYRRRPSSSAGVPPHPAVSSDSTLFTSSAGTGGRPMDDRPPEEENDSSRSSTGPAGTATWVRLRFPSSYGRSTIASQLSEEPRLERRSISDPLDSVSSSMSTDSTSKSQLLLPLDSTSGLSPDRAVASSSSAGGGEDHREEKGGEGHTESSLPHDKDSGGSYRTGKKTSHRSMLVASLLGGRKSRQGEGSGRITPRRMIGGQRNKRSTQIDLRSSASPVVVVKCRQSPGGRRWSEGGLEGYVTQDGQRLEFFTDDDSREKREEETQQPAQQREEPSAHSKTSVHQEVHAMYVYGERWLFNVPTYIHTGSRPLSCSL